ncbi:MAG: hypothetical protein NTY01_03210 [Verrucomicrobia bacterium]|nr:hypothetical protein [Verrucomicrobiota bacterium]
MKSEPAAWMVVPVQKLEPAAAWPQQPRVSHRAARAAAVSREQAEVVRAPSQSQPEQAAPPEQAWPAVAGSVEQLSPPAEAK